MRFASLTFFLLFFYSALSQTDLQNYYNQFDDLTHGYSNDLNTGQRFEDLYPTNSDQEFRYLDTKEFKTGTVKYNTQHFFKSLLKYDLLEDNLLFENRETSSQYAIILDETLVDTFSFNGRDFVRLPEKASTFSFYKHGFFEVVLQSISYTLYVKHEKFLRKKIGDNSIYFRYNTKQTMLLEYKSEFYEINSKNDLIALFPENKDDIKSFYKTYKNLESQNKIEFMKKLLTSLKISN
ncbi:MAG: hypothetical protein ACSHXF_12920 [Aquaticitalea sp.]